jgi:hypothetical protein
MAYYVSMGLGAVHIFRAAQGMRAQPQPLGGAPAGRHPKTACLCVWANIPFGRRGDKRGSASPTSVPAPCPLALQEYTWLIVVHAIVAWLDAYGIGANDVAK